MIRLSLFLALLGTPAFAESVKCAPETAIFKTETGQELRFTVEIVDSPDKRAQGLMWRESLPEGEGMLFVYEQPQPAAFWMKNTLIPLDMVFIDAQGVVRHIHPQARPYDTTPIPGATADDPSPERLMVLEIAGGEAERLGLTRGARLAHPALPQTDAVLPCK